jgi:hypothetical protein
MEEKANMIESLLDKAVDYGKSNYELGKLKVIDKTTDVVSSVIPHFIIIYVIASILLLINLGAAFWIGAILGKVYFGFFVVAAFYVVLGIVIHFFMYNRIKKIFGNYMIKQVFK